MPRGSDAEAAGQELKARTGVVPNAEALIAANQARFSRELQAASKRPIDMKATDEMDEDEAKGYLEDEGEVVSYAVRGPFVVVVYEDENGVLHKSAHPFKGREKQAERYTGRERQGLGAKVKEDVREHRQERQERTTRRSAAQGGATPSTTTE